MKEKIISMFIWVLIWWALIFVYYNFFVLDNSSISEWQISEKRIDSWDVSDEQLEKMAERSWMTTDEIKTKLESWESLRDIMWWQEVGWWQRKVNWWEIVE